MTRAITAAVATVIVASAFAGQEWPVDNFPVAELRNLDGSRSLYHLHSPYGFVAIWEDGKTTFHVYDKDRTNIATTGDLRAFFGLLSKIPDSSEVAWINTCGAPLHYGMPTNKLSEIQGVLEKKRFKMAGIEENNFILCTCYPATNLVFFTNALPNGRGANPATGKAGIARLLTIEHHCSGLPEPAR